MWRMFKDYDFDTQQALARLNHMASHGRIPDHNTELNSL